MSLLGKYRLCYASLTPLTLSFVEGCERHGLPARVVRPAHHERTNSHFHPSWCQRQLTWGILSAAENLRPFAEFTLRNEGLRVTQKWRSP